MGLQYQRNRADVAGDLGWLGDQVAFVQSNPSLQASLVLLKFAPGGRVGAPSAALKTVSPSSYRSNITCPAPCMTTSPLETSGGQADDRTSSVFPGYDNDVIWVGGASGWLFKISGVFLGNPAEVTTGGFPVRLMEANGGVGLYRLLGKAMRQSLLCV